MNLSALITSVFCVAASLLVGCVSNADQPPPILLSQAKTANYFMMEPTRLEKGHIFMRRTAEALEEKEEVLAREPNEDLPTKELAQEEQSPEKSEPQDETKSATADAETVRMQQDLLMDVMPAENFLKPLPPHKWQNIREAQVRVHAENRPFQGLIEDVVDELEPRVGPWRVQWKLTRENRDLLTERFSLNTETTFEQFISSVASFILNYRGLELNFSLFEKDRVLVISDVF